jgi:methylenetetrahydrofolate dehydrogenase (NADP+)/methenyltetrahydrofolate cyclohydrolase
MTAQLLSGKLLAQQIEKELREKISQNQHSPRLDVILIGEHAPSQLYVRHKQEMCKRIGITSKTHHLSEDISEKELINIIDQLNKDKNINGILVQLPLPKHINKENIIENISPLKDVDGFHPYNFGKLAQGNPLLRPCTSYGIIRLLNNYHIKLKGLHTVIVGASNIVGRPMSLELLMADCTVTICHSKTVLLEKHVSEADLLISATGKHQVIPSEWIKKGAVVVDVGIHRNADGTVCGDLDFKSASQKASFITPVPGGVGPMTVAILMENTYKAFLSQEKNLS